MNFLHLEPFFPDFSCIEIPLRPYIHSSSSSGGVGSNYYDRNNDHGKYRNIEDMSHGTISDNERDVPLGSRIYDFSNEFGPANAYNIQNYQAYRSYRQ